MLKKVRDNYRRRKERTRQRREYAILLQSNDAMFRDIGIPRSQVRFLYQKTPWI